MEYSIICNCGHEVKGTDRRMVEAEMWHHAIHDHLALVQTMSAEQLVEIMRGWDRQFDSQPQREV